MSTSVIPKGKGKKGLTPKGKKGKSRIIKPKIKISKKPQRNELFSILQAFDAMEQGEGPPRADPGKCTILAEHIRELTNSKIDNIELSNRPEVKFYPLVKFRGIKVPTKESWEEILSYYESFQDKYIDKLDIPIGTDGGLTPKDLSDLIDLELWFTQIIEPPPPPMSDPEKFSGWEKRELSKVIPGISPYCVKKIRAKFGLGLGSKLPKGWGQKHKSEIEKINQLVPKNQIVRPGERTVLPTMNSRPRTNLSHLKIERTPVLLTKVPSAPSVTDLNIRNASNASDASDANDTSDETSSSELKVSVPTKISSSPKISVTPPISSTFYRRRQRRLERTSSIDESALAASSS